MKVWKIFKKWFLNVLDSFLKLMKNTDFLTKLFFVIPTLLVIGTTPFHADSAGACTSKGVMAYYLPVLFLFLAFLFSIVVAYVGMGYVSKRKVSSFVILMLFVIIYVTCTVLYLVGTATCGGVKDATSEIVKSTFTKSVVVNVIALISAVAGSVFAAMKIDPNYYKERNN